MSKTAKKTSKKTSTKEATTVTRSAKVLVASSSPTNCKHNKWYPIQKLSRSSMMELILKSNGKFITTTHIDKEGNLRTMNITVKKGSKLDDLGYLTVYSTKDKEHRILNPQTLTELSTKGIHYKTKI